MLSKSCLILLIVLCAECLSQQPFRPKGHFTVVAPGTVRSNSTYNIAVSLSEFHRSSWVNISLRIADLSIQQTVEVEPATTKLVSLTVPKVYALKGTLTANGFGAIQWTESLNVLVKDLSFQAYIQTDKQLYKPGEVVRFRVICIDELTRPAVVYDSLDVLIYDSAKTLIKKLSNIKLIQGIFKGELHLSEYTDLGKWKIEVRSSDSPIKSADFSVSVYTLPKFKVDILGPTDASLTDDKLEFMVRATYVHAEPIKGMFSVEVNTLDLETNQHHQTWRKANLAIDGIRKISLSFETDLKISTTRSRRQLGSLYSMDVVVHVADNFTSEVITAKTEIRVHSHPFKVRLQAPEAFYPSAPVAVKVAVTDLQDRPIQDVVNPVKIRAENPSAWGNDAPFEESTVVLDQNGEGVAHLNLSEPDFWEVKVTAKYLGVTSPGKMLNRKADRNFQLHVLQESPAVGEEFIVEVKSKTPIDHFVYEIISRGNILLTERVTVSANATIHHLHLIATFSMMPKITIYVHRIKDNRFDSALKDVYIKRAFKNSIQIATDPEVKPGAMVSINVTTDEGSYVGLMGIDERLLDRTAGSEDLTEDHVFTRLNDYNAIFAHESKLPGFSAGLATLINKHIPGYSEIGIDTRFEEVEQLPDVQIPDVSWPRLRHLFVDGWLFEDLQSTQGVGWQLRPICPDAITSWVITGFSLNPATGLSLTRNATKLTAFQPFYVFMDLPGSVKEGETIQIWVYVFNHLKQIVTTELTFESQSEHLLVVDGDDGDAAFRSTQTLLLPESGRVKLPFFVKPTMSGHFNLTVHATSPIAGDAVQRTLIVESEGIPHMESKTYLIRFTEDSGEDDVIRVNISPNALPNSERIELSVVGDIFGPLMESLRSLVRIPYGTGRETSTHFASNLLVLQYLKAFNHSIPTLETVALTHLEKGYQSLLKFKHLDGSFSLVNRTLERTGDLLHTAIVLWGLQQARSFIGIDQRVVELGLNHLVSTQSSTGAFRSWTGLDGDVTLTSLALLAILAHNATANRRKDVVANGMRYLHEVQDKLESPASVTISTYVLIVGKHEKSGELLAKLHSQRTVKGADVLLTSTDSLESNLIITARNFLNLLQSHPRRTETLFPIVEGLLSSRRLREIPAHLLALDALIGMARAMDFGTKSLSLQVKSDLGEVAILSVNSSNVHMMQSITLKGGTRSVHLKTTGKGFVVVNIKSRYNLLPAHAPSSASYRTNVTLLSQKGRIDNLKVCVSTDGSPSFIKMEVHLPTGCAVLQNSLDNQLNENVMSLQIGERESSLFVIIKDLGPTGTCIALHALREFSVTNAKPMSTVVYDIYNEDRKVTSLHDFMVAESNIGWVWV